MRHLVKCFRTGCDEEQKGETATLQIAVDKNFDEREKAVQHLVLSLLLCLPMARGGRYKGQKGGRTRAHLNRSSGGRRLLVDD